jgi:hypothetical protein
VCWINSVEGGGRAGDSLMWLMSDRAAAAFIAAVLLMVALMVLMGA